MSFFKRKRPSQPAPEWTPFESLSEYQLFIEHIDKYFRKKNLPYTQNEDAIIVQDESWKEMQLGLHNLAQICKQNKRSEWRSIVHDHFEGLQAAMEFEESFLSQAHDYSYAAPFIGVRIYHKGYVAHIGDEATIKEPIADDLVALLVFDFPHNIINIKPETTIQWNKTNEELYDMGRANIRQKYPANIHIEAVNNIRIWFIQENHLFVANNALDLHLLSVPTGAHGSFVGIPNRHVVMLYPIDNMEVMDALHPFIAILQGMHRDGPGSVSDSLYWYNNGRLIRLHYALEKDELHFQPTEEFHLMLENLGPKK